MDENFARKTQRLVAYLKFLFKSTNQHGVHSPFVFDLVTRCLYDRKKYPEYKLLSALPSLALLFRKKVQFLFRLQRYFNFETCCLSPNNTPPLIGNILRVGNPHIKIIDLQYIDKQPNPDFVYIHSLDLPDFWTSFDLFLKHCKNETFFFINAPHQSPKTQKTWKIIQNHPRITVTIDSFFFGLLSLRKEQAKQHFVIRI